MPSAEDNLQIACVNWFRLQYPSKWRLLFHPANGGARNAREGAKLKKMGVVPGVNDLILVAKSKPVFYELKTMTGKQSKAQKEFQADIEEQGYDYLLIRSVDEFIEDVKTRVV